MNLLPLHEKGNLSFQSETIIMMSNDEDENRSRCCCRKEDFMQDFIRRGIRRITENMIPSHVIRFRFRCQFVCSLLCNISPPLFLDVGVWHDFLCSRIHCCPCLLLSFLHSHPVSTFCEASLLSHWDN
jgi:hypothetical protein